MGVGSGIERKVGGVEDQQVEAEGRLEEVDDVGFRRLYGTEWALLDEEEEEVAYALKSDNEDLGVYVGQHVRLSGFWWRVSPSKRASPATLA